MSKIRNFFKNNKFCIKIYSVLRWHEKFDFILFKLNEFKLKRNHLILFDKKNKTKFFIPNYQKDFIQKHIFNTKSFFEKDYLDYITKKWKDGLIGEIIKNKSVLDIGCNIGNHTLYFLNICNASKIHCFEPVENTFSILKKNIEINNLKDRVKLWNVGVGSHKSLGHISHYDENNIGSTTIQEDSSGNIDIISIDELNLQDPIGLIKIDVEGFELEVIKGILTTLKKNKPFIMIELRHEFKQEIENLLFNIGYQFEILNEDPRFNDCLFFQSNNE